MNTENIKKVKGIGFDQGGIFNDNDESYEYLFNTTDASGGDAPSSSLLNLDTMRRLCELGESTPNILKN